MTDADRPQTDAAHADVGIVSALPMELAPFLDRCDRVKQYSGGDFKFRGGRYGDVRVAVVQAGVGGEKAQRATQALIDAHTPPWVLACGFCGALRPDMKIGDIVMADSIVDTHGQELRVDVKLPGEPQPGLHVGRIVTADGIVRSVQQKQQLAEQHEAIAVDMESQAVARVCQATKTLFLAVRAVSDDLSADLPPEVLSVIGSTGTMRLGATLGALWKRPGSMKEMWHLREAAQKAAVQLASFLDGVVTQLYEAKH